MMLSSTTILAALTALTPLVQGQFARVENKCNVNAYVQSVPYDGSAAGPLVTLTPGRIFTEPFRASGSTVKISNQPSLQAPLFFGYSQSDTPYLMYYELNTRYGNPFKNNYVSQTTSRVGCQGYHCKPNDPSCYSGPGMSKVYNCGRPTNITTTLCAPH